MKRRGFLKALAGGVAAMIGVSSSKAYDPFPEILASTPKASSTVHSTYSLGWKASMEMLDDDQQYMMNQMSADLAEKARESNERLAWSLINDGFVHGFK